MLHLPRPRRIEGWGPIMSPKSNAASRAFRFAVVAIAVVSAGDAFAQATGCDAVQKHLEQRKTIAQSLQVHGKAKMDAKVACAGFSLLVVFGVALFLWSVVFL